MFCRKGADNISKIVEEPKYCRKVNVIMTANKLTCNLSKAPNNQANVSWRWLGLAVFVRPFTSRSFKAVEGGMINRKLGDTSGS